VLIYLDSKDLITLVDGLAVIRSDDAVASLTAGKHKVVVSFETVMEIAGPLAKRSARTNVMAFCARLETLPLSFLHEAMIAPLELREAMRAFEEGREFDSSATCPFVDRFDASIPVQGRAPTHAFIHYGIAETVFDIWATSPDVIEGYAASHGQRYVDLMAADRQIKNPATLVKHFVTKIQRDLSLYRIRAPRAGVDAFARWIYRSAARCPGIRLGYEVYHQVLRNKAAGTKTSDIVDLVRVRSIPYVDLFTMDSAMLAYTSQAVRSTGAQYRAQLLPSLAAAAAIWRNPQEEEKFPAA
jgi:hypothetical protein